MLLEHILFDEKVFEAFIDNLIDENVLDKMGKKKVSNSMRRGFIGGGVYTEFPSDREADVVKKVSKNLHRIPYSSNPPTAPIGSEPKRTRKKK